MSYFTFLPEKKSSKRLESLLMLLQANEISNRYIHPLSVSFIFTAVLDSDRFREQHSSKSDDKRSELWKPTFIKPRTLATLGRRQAIT